MQVDSRKQDEVLTYALDPTVRGLVTANGFKGITDAHLQSISIHT